VKDHLPALKKALLAIRASLKEKGGHSAGSVGSQMTQKTCPTP
jgi:hypothetical protein